MDKVKKTNWPRRGGPGPQTDGAPLLSHDGPLEDAYSSVWESLEPHQVTSRTSARERIVALQGNNAARAQIDRLRTRVINLARRKGWQRFAVTSPSAGCGKTFVALNLALSVARTQGMRALLVDLDLRSPTIAKRLRFEAPPLRHALNAPFEEVMDNLRCVDNDLAVLGNGRAESDSGDILGGTRCSQVLNYIIDTLQPDIVIYDCGPMMIVDDVMAASHMFDAVLLVAADGVTSVAEAKRCVELIQQESNYAGCILNKAADDREVSAYGYQAYGTYGYPYVAGSAPQKMPQADDDRNWI